MGCSSSSVDTIEDHNQRKKGENSNINAQDSSISEQAISVFVDEFIKFIDSSPEHILVNSITSFIATHLEVPILKEYYVAFFHLQLSDSTSVSKERAFDTIRQLTDGNEIILSLETIFGQVDFVNSIFKEYADMDGMDFEHFRSFIVALVPTQLDFDRIFEIFKNFDKDGNQHLDADEIGALFKKLTVVLYYPHFTEVCEGDVSVQGVLNAAFRKKVRPLVLNDAIEQSLTKITQGQLITPDNFRDVFDYVTSEDIVEEVEKYIEAQIVDAFQTQGYPSLKVPYDFADRVLGMLMGEVASQKFLANDKTYEVLFEKLDQNDDDNLDFNEVKTLFMEHWGMNLINSLPLIFGSDF
eukprot:TRINITY_DN1682_c0_g1_i1.p1 TRINITY_DN1682_c0_g1~~TRINITY_DN1682_c0_g1_i1.p1  ORF type:complete len:354 (+),score=106.85 TRINITY_DN1682_c0_g1_i1:38-1099(+)